MPEKRVFLTKKDGPNIRAEKLSGTGAVYYSIWLDDQGEQYFKIESVVGGRGAGNGTFGSDAYKLEDITAFTEIRGYDITNGAVKTTKDRNMSGFLRAILVDVLKRFEDESNEAE